MIAIGNEDDSTKGDIILAEIRSINKKVSKIERKLSKKGKALKELTSRGPRIEVSDPVGGIFKRLDPLMELENDDRPVDFKKYGDALEKAYKENGKPLTSYEAEQIVGSYVSPSRLVRINEYLILRGDNKYYFEVYMKELEGRRRRESFLRHLDNPGRF